MVRGKTGLLAEISPCSDYAGQGLPAALAAELASFAGYVEDAVAEGGLGVQSFVVDDAKAFKVLAPEIPIGVLDANRPTDDELVALSEWADNVNLQHTVTDTVLVTRVHKLGMGINVWTVNDPSAMRILAGLDVNGIITDYPQSLTQP